MNAPEWDGEIPAFSDNKIVAVAPPFTELARMAKRLEGTGVRLAAQNVYFEESGAYTGEISAEMLAKLGVSYCIVGHSERRGYFGETDEDCLKKIEKLAEHGIAAILCVGESLETREAGDEYQFVGTQVEAVFEKIRICFRIFVQFSFDPFFF